MNNVVSLPKASPHNHRECPACGKSASAVSPRIETFPYLDGEDQVILEARVPVWECATCGTKFTDGDAEEIRHEAVCRYLERLTPAEVRAIREQYRLSQHEWAVRTGLGIASVKRWELGNAIQEKATDKYLRLLRQSEVFARLASLERSDADMREPQFRTARFSPQVYESADRFRLRKRLA